MTRAEEERAGIVSCQCQFWCWLLAMACFSPNARSILTPTRPSWDNLSRLMAILPLEAQRMRNLQLAVRYDGEEAGLATRRGRVFWVQAAEAGGSSAFVAHRSSFARKDASAPTRRSLGALPSFSLYGISYNVTSKSLISLRRPRVATTSHIRNPVREKCRPAVVSIVAEEPPRLKAYVG